MDPSRPLRVLIVDDSEDDAQLLVRHLTRGGYDLTFARVCTPAAMSAELARPWDMVLCDYAMPSYSGMQALQQLRETNSEVPFIFVSGQIGEDNAVAALKRGAQDYVMKGNFKRLIPAVERELRETDQRRERKKLERQLIQLEKFEAIGQLAGGIAHDFNNVIGAVLGLAQLGSEEAPAGSRLQERFQRIYEQARHASGLTAQLLAFARKQILQPQILNLNDVITEAVSLLHSAIPARINFQTVLAPDLATTSADPTQIKQILINLCINARDAMPNDGRLLIETQNAELNDGELDPLLASPGRYILIKVSDTGTGMDAKTLDSIFEPFFSTKEVGHGTGLGLATVYGIVKQHGGFVRVTSELQRGSTFHVYLPAAKNVVTASESPAATPLVAGIETGTILVAEDHEGIRQLVYEILTSAGHNVLLANDGEEALLTFNANREEIQLAVLDVIMPHMGGIEAYSEIRELKPGLPVILMTGYTEETNLVKSALGEGARLLSKPFTPVALKKAITSALASIQSEQVSR
jgi:two-component system cell cycle sensor histidine kinase/response regulator CckA